MLIGIHILDISGTQHVGEHLYNIRVWFSMPCWEPPPYCGGEVCVPRYDPESYAGGGLSSW
jgi:hypothetical protein